jgi:hypothetical protein
MSNKPRKKKKISKLYNQLTEYEVKLIKEVEDYKKILAVTSLISLNQHGIDTDGRGIRAAKIFTRQTVSATSFLKLLPKISKHKSNDTEIWDVCSIASLSRNLIEGYLAQYYSGTEKITSEEAELRFFLGQLHRNREWYSLRKMSDANDPELKKFEEGFVEQKARIKNHAYLNKLSAPQKNKALQGHEMYMTKADFENKNKVCVALKSDYQLLSNLVHPLPLSIERIDNVRGRGVRNEADSGYCILCILIAKKYLAASTIEIAEHFPGKLGHKFKAEIDSIRKFVLDS